MKIKNITHQSRRDFTAVYECQHCGHEQKGDGYDDAYFHEKVIPAMKCASCGRSGNEVTSAPSVPAHAVL